MEGLHPDRFTYSNMTEEYSSGESSTLQAGIAHTREIDGYDKDEPVVCFAVRDEEGHRFRVMSLDDIAVLEHDLRETRDTRNNCNLCFNSVSHYKGSISSFDLMVEVRYFNQDLHHFDPTVTNVSHCEDCQGALDMALEEVVNEASGEIVLNSI